MNLEVKAALYDVQRAGQLVMEFVADTDFETYRVNAMLKSAVERQFITIGEALNKAIQRSPDLSQRITDVRKIIDFRNLLTHGYTAISDAVVWDIVQTNLPVLQQEINALLAELP